MGVIAAYFLTPFVLRPAMTAGGRTVLFVMLAVIGYTISGGAARGITRYLKNQITGDWK